MESPQSCDTFVVLPPFTKQGIVFGKNSDRPQNEVQEVIYIEGCSSRKATKRKCTYITIDDDGAPLNSVILSKPAWMWGAEMGANDKNVVIGNEAVWTQHNDGDGDARHKRLLGMDLLRLGLELGNSAEEALDVITSMLEKYGQGGPCSEHDDSLLYHNSFLIADPKSAWVLETSGSLWVAEKVENGFRNISNGLTISTKIDRSSKDIKEKAQSLGFWDGQSEFNFTKCFSSGGDEDRQIEGERLLRTLSSEKSFDVKDMFQVLRHEESRICRGCDDGFPTQASQVSVLNEDGLTVHWLTATPDPRKSCFKPFVFTSNPKISPFTASPIDESAREHELYKRHKQFCIKAKCNTIVKNLHDFENQCYDKVNDIVKKIKCKEMQPQALDNLLKDCVENEMELYT